jgi:hypothetical protein
MHRVTKVRRFHEPRIADFGKSTDFPAWLVFSIKMAEMRLKNHHKAAPLCL